MKVYLHIGLHKTATTFLQNRVFPELDIAYVRTGGTLVRNLTWDQPYTFDAEATRAELLATVPADAEAVVISSKDLSGTPMLGYVNRNLALERLHRMFPDASVLVGLRGQRGMIWSLYKHYVSRGGTRSLEAVLDRTGHPGPGWMDLEGFRYGPYLDSIAALFGEDAVRPLVYEQLQDDPDGFVAGVAEFLGSTVEGSVKVERINAARLADRHVRARRTLNRVLLNRGHTQGFLPVPTALQKILVGGISAVARSVPDRVTLDSLDGRYVDDNEALAKRWDLDLTGSKQVNAAWFPGRT